MSAIDTSTMAPVTVILPFNSNGLANQVAQSPLTSIITLLQQLLVIF